MALWELQAAMSRNPNDTLTCPPPWAGQVQRLGRRWLLYSSHIQAGPPQEYSRTALTACSRVGYRLSKSPGPGPGHQSQARKAQPPPLALTRETGPIGASR